MVRLSQCCKLFWTRYSHEDVPHPPRPPSPPTAAHTPEPTCVTQGWGTDYRRGNEPKCHRGSLLLKPLREEKKEMKRKESWKEVLTSREHGTPPPWWEEGWLISVNTWNSNAAAAFALTMKQPITTFLWMIHLFDVRGGSKIILLHQQTRLACLFVSPLCVCLVLQRSSQPQQGAVFRLNQAAADRLLRFKSAGRQGAAAKQPGLRLRRF